MHSESRRSIVPPFHVMDVWRAAARHQLTHGVALSLAAGQPATPAPAPVLAAARQALTTQVLGYTDVVGMRQLREAIAAHHRSADGIEVSAEDVVVTTGSSGGITLIFLAAFDVGDTVVVTRPGYPAYRNTLAALGCRVEELRCGPETRYQPTIDMLEALPQPPAGLVVASPANPTGTVLGADEMAELTAWCDRHGTLLISDEIYHGIVYSERKATSAWATSRHAVVIGSVSKYFSMTGWRLGWLLVPHGLHRAIERLSSNMTICPPAVSQYAAVACFTDESLTELNGHVRRYAANREVLLAGLTRLGITDIAPSDGAFYVYADVGHLTDDSLRWCFDVLDRCGVALAPGVDFDPIDGNRTVRFSFCGAAADIEAALDRLASVAC